MGLAKNSNTTTTGTPPQEGGSQSTIESGTQAALDRLKTAEPKAAEKSEPKQYKQRDHESEARGKTRCALYEAALMSPALAGMQWEGAAAFKKLIREMADDGVAYTFEE